MGLLRCGGFETVRGQFISPRTVWLSMHPQPSATRQILPQATPLRVALGLLALAATLSGFSGCGILHPNTADPNLPPGSEPGPGMHGSGGLLGHGLLGHDRGGPLPPLENPLIVPPLNEENMWRQIVDTIDDYFKIQHEDRIRSNGGVISEGRIGTFPETSSGYLEPWRRDSTSKPERLLATLQSMRRRALVRVAPGPEGYQIHVAVFKELEDVSRPEFATIGGSAQRHDGSVVRTSPVRGADTVTLGWISAGRDPNLEQQILYELHYRLTAGAPTTPPGRHHGLLP